MRKWILVTWLLSLALVSLPRPHLAAGHQVIAASVLERVSKAFQHMRSLRASLSQQKIYGQLGISDPIERGVLYIKRKKNRDIQVRIEIIEPARRVITVRDNKFVLFQPTINQAIEGRLHRGLVTGNPSVGFLTYFFGGFSRLTDDYEVMTLGDEILQGQRTTHLRLTPMRAEKGLYRQIDLWVDHRLWMPTQQKLVEMNQDVTLLRLSDVQVNINLSDSIFAQRLPRHVKRLRG